ncbi:n-acetylmuramoyl-L-alanine amidase CwlD [Clostridium sp. CAG:1219]|nr:n-acetylmuramoyl-L-alanine amidase CwlD [Clostridium sp. CAG:1219]
MRDIGKPDEGAVGLFGTTEQAINLSISLKLQKLIEQCGAKVILTRSDENGIYSIDSKSIREKKVSDIKNRVDLGNNSNADIFISIHLNKYPPSEIYRGWQTFYQNKNDESENLATLIQNNINKNIDYENNRTPMKITDVYIMKNVTIPTVIVECGFLSNSEETTLLKDDTYQYKLAWGIFLGIQEYFYNTSIVN